MSTQLTLNLSCTPKTHSVNTQGTPRLTKYYQHLANPSLKTLLPERIFKLISSRPASLCNFLDAPGLSLAPSSSYSGRRNGNIGLEDEKTDVWTSDDTRIVYRNYATLYFVFVVDGSESELGVLDLIQVRLYPSQSLMFVIWNAYVLLCITAVQVFVESLDRAFENVCELDLVFHFDEVHSEFLTSLHTISTNSPNYPPLRQGPSHTCGSDTRWVGVGD